MLIGPSYVWDKHAYSGADVLDCSRAELFPPHPPESLLTGAMDARSERLALRALVLQAQTATALNAALAEYFAGECGEAPGVDAAEMLRAAQPVELTPAQVRPGATQCECVRVCVCMRAVCLCLCVGVRACTHARTRDICVCARTRARTARAS